ncbi:MAG: NAD(P)/FAD-dependent oxidoreductase [Candidatus Syntropharchaeales archaeon]
MRFGIIGGGVTGLVAGYYLSKRGYDVTIFEAEDEVGGLLGSYHINRGDKTYHIERFYHHIFRGDAELIELIEELGLSGSLEWRKGSTGYHVNGEIYPLTTPGEILRFPHLTLLDKIRLAALVLRSKIGSFEDLDNKRARDLIERIGGKGVHRNFFEPLLRSKFGDERNEVSAAWLFGRISIRSDRSIEGEHLGYMRGGFQLLVDALKEHILDQGGVIHTGEPVTQILIENGRVSGIESTKETYHFDNVISTVSPDALNRISGIGCRDVPYQGACCALFGLRKSLMDGIYWLNIAEDLPFGALIEHTNFVPSRWYGGENLLYVASYFQNIEDPRWKLDEKDVIGVFIRGIKKLFPDFDEGDVNWWQLTRTPDAGPIYKVGFKDLILPYRTEIDGLCIAGMFSRANYPERSINGSVIAGKSCVDLFFS